MEADGPTGGEISHPIVMRHVCKFCHKGFPCGRSLGGHMRSHLIANPEKVNSFIERRREMNAAGGEFSGEGKIGQDLDQAKCCKECGKAFQSSKALSGHMKSHAVEREKEKEKEKMREKENSLLGGDEIEKDPRNQVVDRESDNEGVEASPRSKCKPRKRTNRRQRYMGANTVTTAANTVDSACYNNGGSSSASEIDQQEQEDVAKCLIMLSRDVGPWGGVNGEFSDNNSVFLEPRIGEKRGLKVFKWIGESSSSKEIKDVGFVENEILSSGYERFLAKMKCSEMGRNLISSNSRKAKKSESFEVEKRSKFECTTCNKTFHSYQALGGHRASHKKNKGCSPLKPEGSETGEIITNIPPPFHAQTQAKGANKHECPICFKEFSSGQALGGHKRSHLMATSAQMQMESSTNKFVSVTTTTVTTTTTTTATTSSSHEVRDFLDLNLPAPVEAEEEEDHHQEIVGFKPWWIESTNKHEQPVGLISN